MIERLTSHRLLASSAAGLLLFVAAGCVNPNYDGEGNNFTIEGPVQDVGDNSITIFPIKVLDAEGKAADWFHADDETQVHDNYHNEWCNQKDVGQVYDTAGHIEELSDVREGEWVKLTGHTRESKESCGKTPIWDDRPVFDTAAELPR